jgi:DNA-binding transcriptional LysR family regulator
MEEGVPVLDRIEYFLTLAEEKNITHAAKRLYVSQQCLSAYLKELEEEYGVQLFYRKPQFMLTPAGETFYRAAQQMQLLNKDVKSQLQNRAYDSQGQLLVGVHSSRSATIMPSVMKEFWTQFPNIKVDVVDGNTKLFERLLLDGDIDMFIGVNPAKNLKLEQIPLLDEGVYITISDSMVRKYFYYDYPGCLERFEQGVSLEEFLHVPFIFTNEDSNIYTVLNAYLIQLGLALNIRMTTNNGALRTEMTAMGYGASISAEIRLLDIAEKNNLLPPDAKLFTFPIVDIPLSRICLVYRKGIYKTAYFEKFASEVVAYFKENF